jgi:hypothetical protein
MSFAHGSSSAVLVNDKTVSSEVSGWTMSHSRAVSEVTTVGQTAGAAGAKFVPGLMSGSLALRGPQDNDPTGGLSKEITDAIGVDNDFVVTCLPEGLASVVGKPAFFMQGDVTEHAIDALVADAVGYTLSAQADESVEMGYVLHAHGAETADGNGTAVDRGASPITPTTGGLVAGIHVTAYSGLTSAAIKIQHSTDASTWADLVAFTSVTAVGREIVKVANGTTVNRYLRVVTDVTGSGSVTFLVSAAPR